MGVLRQCLCGTAACFLCLCLGLIYAWPSSTIKIFISTNTTLHRPMGEGELALFGSLSSVGALVVTPMAGYFLDVVGRRWCTIIGALTQVLTWSIIVASNRVEAILIATFLSGAGGSSFLVVPVFIGEFCQESIRGALMSCSIVFYGMGMLVSYMLGGFLQYQMMNYVCLTTSVVGVLLVSCLKESPMYLMKKGFEEDAVKSIMFFRGVKKDSKEVIQEMENIRRALNPDMDNDCTLEEEKLQKGEILLKPKENLSVIQFIKKSPSTRRAMKVVLTLVALSILQGLVVLQVYAEPLLALALPGMVPAVGAVLLAVAAVVAGLVAAWLVDTVGRRTLMIWSSLASAVCLLVLGAALQQRWSAAWLTATALYGFCIACSAGAGTVPFVLLAEVFLPEVRSLMSMVAVEFAWLCNFVILFLFNPIVTALGLGGVFYIFSFICFLSVVFTYFFVPETMGIPVDAIQLLFTKKRRQNGRS